MNKNFKKMMLAVLTLLMLVTLFAGCTMEEPWGIEVWGAWEGDNTAYGSSEKTIITFTNKTVSMDMPAAWGWDHSGDVIEFDNDNFFDAEANPATGDFGSVIFKITAHEGDDSQIGKYNVIRWKDMTATELKYAESANQFTTLEEAKAAAASNFSFYNDLVKSVE